MLGAVAICNGKIAKKDEMEVIYAEKADGRKFVLHSKTLGPLVLSKKKWMAADMQKAIVERILDALEKDDIAIADHWNSRQFSRIKKGTCFEQIVVAEELDGWNFRLWNAGSGKGKEGEEG